MYGFIHSREGNGRAKSEGRAGRAGAGDAGSAPRRARSKRLDLLLEPAGIDAHGARAPVGDGAALAELREEAGHLLAGGADAPRHLFVGGVLLAEKAAVGLRDALLRQAQGEPAEAERTSSV